MLRVLAAVLFSLLFFGLSSAWAENCSPHCDYWHDYGPYDFTYIRPGLFGYPVCGPLGDCAPYLVYTYQRGYRFRKSVTIRARPRPIAVRPRS
jgi:hypothetical protein